MVYFVAKVVPFVAKGGPVLMAKGGILLMAEIGILYLTIYNSRSMPLKHAQKTWLLQLISVISLVFNRSRSSPELA